MAVLITKMNGEMEPFREDKLDRSLTRAGAAKDVREHIIGHIKEELREGMTTQEIYQHAFELLKSGARRPVAARYSIKRAVLDLGPSGFPFEQFVGEVLKAIGYTNIKIGAALRGKCAPHEVDVTATDTNGVHMAAEAKFHNSLGIKTDLKVALYVKARWDDLRAGGANIDEGWIITNTRFTRDAARYGACNNLHLLGWDYPKERGLEILIGETRVHPITALTSLTQAEKRTLLDADVVLCRRVLADQSLLTQFSMDEKRTKDVLDELKSLCTETI